MNKKQQGFTLVELAVVLVIIGLILGMAFKGRALIDQAKVKSIQAQYNKVLGGFNIFFDRYGFYPGDGCAVAGAVSPATCVAARNGQIATGVEGNNAMTLLTGTGILTPPDVMSPFGLRWGMVLAPAGMGTTAGIDYLTVVTAAGAMSATVDPRYACALDRLMDDGVPATGDVRTTGLYVAATDCWDQTAAGVGTAPVSLAIRMLP